MIGTDTESERVIGVNIKDGTYQGWNTQSLHRTRLRKFGWGSARSEARSQREWWWEVHLAGRGLFQESARRVDEHPAM